MDHENGWRSGMRERGAFTLVELLVVIGIIAVLIAILLPVLKAAREQARAVVCASNQRQIYLAMAAYSTANQGVLPIPGYFDDVHDYVAVRMSNLNTVNYQLGTMWNYLGASPAIRQQIFLCPSDTSPRVPGDGLFGGIGALPGERNYSYSLNPRLHGGPGPGGLWSGVKTTRIVHSERKMLIYELQFPPEVAGEVTGLGADPNDSRVHGLLTTRHRGVGNTAMADGHVETIDPALFNSMPGEQPIGIFTAAYLQHIVLTSDYPPTQWP